MLVWECLTSCGCASAVTSGGADLSAAVSSSAE